MTGIGVGELMIIASLCCGLGFGGGCLVLGAVSVYYAIKRRPEGD